jgi:4-amino-4-deoxy-L-arabinose transferase-like glycosyltransferase
MTDDRFIRLAVLLAIVGTAQALLYLPFVTPHTTADTPSYTADAHAILHGSYSIPLGERDVTAIDWPRELQDVKQRDTYRTPGYPAFLALLGGGTGDISRTLVLLVQALLVGAGAFPVALWVRRLFGPTIGLAGAAAYALDPYSKRYASLVLAEGLSGFLLAVMAYLFVRAWQERSLRWWAACGAVCGALTLVRPVFLMAIPLVVVAALVRRGGWRLAARSAAVFAACALVFVVPWLARAMIVIGQPALQNFGIGWGTLLAAHGEGLGDPATEVAAKPGFIRDFNSVHRFVPSPEKLRTDPNAHARYLSKADKHQRTLAFRLYRHRLRDEPGQVLWEYAYRAYFLWMIHEDWLQPSSAAVWLLRTIDWIVLVLAAAGAAIAFRRGGPARAFVIFLLLYTATSAVGHVEARYTIPLRGLYLPLAVLPLVAVAARKAQTQTATVARLPTESR